MVDGDHRNRIRGAKALAGVVAWLAAALACGTARGAPGDADAAAAFDRGAGGDESFRLEIERVGGTAVLTGSAGGGGTTPLAIVCALCTRAELIAEARSLGAALAARGASVPPCRLELTGLPPGASVRVDDLPGRADGRPQLLEPGRHEVRAAGGGRTRSRSVELSPGESARLGWDEMKAAPTPRRPLRLAIAAGGLGLALAAAGAALVLLDGECATVPDASGHCEKLHGDAPVGWSLVGVGAAAFAFGVAYGIATGIRGRAGEESEGAP